MEFLVATVAILSSLASFITVQSTESTYAQPSKDNGASGFTPAEDPKIPGWDPDRAEEVPTDNSSHSEVTPIPSPAPQSEFGTDNSGAAEMPADDSSLAEFPPVWTTGSPPPDEPIPDPAVKPGDIADLDTQRCIGCVSETSTEEEPTLEALTATPEDEGKAFSEGGIADGGSGGAGDEVVGTEQSISSGARIAGTNQTANVTSSPNIVK